MLNVRRRKDSDLALYDYGHSCWPALPTAFHSRCLGSDGMATLVGIYGFPCAWGQLIKKETRKFSLSPWITNSIIPVGYFFFLLELVVVFFFLEPEPHPAMSHTSFLSAD